jgi:hypothetical protein
VACTRYSDDSSSFLSISAEALPQEGAPSIVAPKITVPLLLRESTSFFVSVLLALVLFASGSILLTVTQESLPAYLDVWTLRDPLLRRLVAAVAQAAALFWLFRLTGKKPV